MRTHIATIASYTCVGSRARGATRRTPEYRSADLALEDAPHPLVLPLVSPEGTSRALFALAQKQGPSCFCVGIAVD